MSDTVKRSKFSFQVSDEQGLRLKALGKWKRRRVCGKLREALDEVLKNLESEHETTK